MRYAAWYACLIKFWQIEKINKSLDSRPLALRVKPKVTFNNYLG